VQLLASIGRPGGIRSLLVHGSNVVVSAPDAASVRAALRRLDLLVVCDFFLSETARLADVVLPVTQWAEEEGTMTNLEGRVLRRRKSIEPPQGARSELWIFAELAARLNAPGVYEVEPAAVFDELARASEGGIADYSGLSHTLLDTGRAAYWPYPAGTEGTPRLFTDRFGTPDGLARIVPVRVHPPAEPAAKGDELVLITGRLLEHYQSGSQTRRVPELNEAQPVLRAQVHPATAADRGLADGDRIELRNRRGSVFAVVQTTGDVRPDTVFLPFHYPELESANILVSDATDPVSAMPEFKRTIVSIRAAAAAQS
jgi:assimilatory nitrate reductase catalytic subunit